MKLTHLIELTAAPDGRATEAVAKAVAAAIGKAFGSQYVKYELDRDGAAQFTVQMSGRTSDPDPTVITPRSLSAAIDPLFRDYRAKGWTFTQPQGGKFTVAAPAQSEAAAATAAKNPAREALQILRRGLKPCLLGGDTSGAKEELPDLERLLKEAAKLIDVHVIGRE